MSCPKTNKGARVSACGTHGDSERIHDQSGRRDLLRQDQDDAETYQCVDTRIDMDCTIRELAETIARFTGLAGKQVFDATKQDRTKRKSMDVSSLKALGLQKVLRETYG